MELIAFYAGMELIAFYAGMVLIAFIAGIGVSALAIRILGFGGPTGAPQGDSLAYQAPPSPEIKAIQAGMEELLESKRRVVRTRNTRARALARFR